MYILNILNLLISEFGGQRNVKRGLKGVDGQEETMYLNKLGGTKYRGGSLSSFFVVKGDSGQIVKIVISLFGV